MRGAGFMWRPSVSPSTRPSVCPVDQKQQRRAGGLLLSAVRAGDIGRQLRARCGKRAAACAGAQQQRRRSTALSSKCGQRHVDSRRRRLNTDLFVSNLAVAG